MKLIKGTLDVLVLKTLSWEPMHGFEITTWLEDRSDGQLTIDESALYQGLHRLEGKGLIEANWGLTENNRRARYYELTKQGRIALAAESRRITDYVRILTAVLDAGSA